MPRRSETRDGPDDRPRVGRVGLHASPIISNNVTSSRRAPCPADAEEPHPREGLHPRLRRAHRQAVVDLPHAPQNCEFGNTRWWRTRGPTPATSALGAVTIDEELGALHASGAPDGDTTAAIVRQWPVRRKPRRDRSENGTAEVALQWSTRIWDFDIPARQSSPTSVNWRRSRRSRSRRANWLYVFDP